MSRPIHFTILMAMVCSLSSSSIRADIDRGSWGPVLTFGIAPDGTLRQAVHAIVLKTGEVLCISEYVDPQAPLRNHMFLWTPPKIDDPDPENPGTFVTINPPTINSDSQVMYCAGHSQLPDGRIVFVGGGEGPGPPQAHSHAFIFDPEAPISSPWQRLNDMPNVTCGGGPVEGVRWYPTCNTLGDGRVVVVGGDELNPAGGCHTADAPLILDVTVFNAATGLFGQWTALPKPEHFYYYPNFFALSNSSAFYTGFESSAQIDPLPDPLIDHRVLTLPGGSWISFTDEPHIGSTNVMFWPDQILRSGGGRHFGAELTAQTWSINPTTKRPVWQPLADMTAPRRTHNLIMMPDGNVLAVGGLTTNGLGGEMSILEAESYNPDGDFWEPMAAMTHPRGYHSTAFLLPDGRIVATSLDYDPEPGVPPNPSDPPFTAQIYSPRYLFGGPRPQLTQIPYDWTVSYRGTFSVSVDREIAKAVFIRPATVTHAFTQDQHFVPLDVGKPSGLDYPISAPSNPDIAPPGYYMLFLLTPEGVPSIASMIKLQ